MKLVKGLKIAVTVIMGLTIVFWLFIGLVGMMEGVPGAVNNLVIVAVVGVLTWLGWKRPLLAGILLALLGIILTMYFFLAFENLSQIFMPLFLMCAPMTICGLLFIEADWAAKKK